MTFQKQNNKEDKKTGFIITLIIVPIVIFGLWYLTYILLKDCDTRGTFGDMFGSVNALFSGLALAGIILTILLQRNELKLQREELKETRKEFKIQNKTLKLQRFENTFFSMLDLHHQIVNAIDLSDFEPKDHGRGYSKINYLQELEKIVISGRDVFERLYTKMRSEMQKDEQNYNKIYDEYYKRIHSDFGHYFRHLYRIIKLIDSTDFSDNYDETSPISKRLTIFNIKYKYTSIIRAQLSDGELLFLFYNCLSKNGVDKFKPYIEEYSIFKNLPKEQLASKDHIKLFKKKAFEPI